ncbi:MAG: PLD nuclease N-terminal domain-containing protein [Faecalibacterium sp.]
MVIYLLNSDMDNSAKITWLVVIALVPVPGRGAVLVDQRRSRPPDARAPPQAAGTGYPGAAAPGCPNAGTAESTGVGCGLAGLLLRGKAAASRCMRTRL